MKLSDSHADKLKLITLTLLSNMTCNSNDKTIFPYKLILTDQWVVSLHPLIWS